MDNTPDGANEDSRAPWNQNTQDSIVERGVTVSICLSKTIKIRVAESTLEDDSVLRNNVRIQTVLPHEAHFYLRDGEPDDSRREAMKDLQDWIVNDFEVILEP